MSTPEHRDATPRADEFMYVREICQAQLKLRAENFAPKRASRDGRAGSGEPRSPLENRGEFGKRTRMRVRIPFPSRGFNARFGSPYSARSSRLALFGSVFSARSFRLALFGSLFSARSFRLALFGSLFSARSFRLALFGSLFSARSFRLALFGSLFSARSFRLALFGSLFSARP